MWASFSPNFGGTPFQSKTDHITKAQFKCYVVYWWLYWCTCTRLANDPIRLVYTGCPHQITPMEFLIISWS